MCRGPVWTEVREGTGGVGERGFPGLGVFHGGHAGPTDSLRPLEGFSPSLGKPGQVQWHRLNPHPTRELSSQLRVRQVSPARTTSYEDGPTSSGGRLGGRPGSRAPDLQARGPAFDPQFCLCRTGAVALATLYGTYADTDGAGRRHTRRSTSQRARTRVQSPPPLHTHTHGGEAL